MLISIQRINIKNKGSLRYLKKNRQWVYSQIETEKREIKRMPKFKELRKGLELSKPFRIFRFFSV